MKNIIMLISIIYLPLTVLAEVTDSSFNNFRVDINLIINSQPVEVYKAILGGISYWWNPEHTYSGDARNLYIESIGEGCFCEKLVAGSIKHMEVLYVSPPGIIRMRGALGPLQKYPVNGIMTFEMSKIDSKTEFKYSYIVAGFIPGGLKNYSAEVDKVLSSQLYRLKR